MKTQDLLLIGLGGLALYSLLKAQGVGADGGIGGEVPQSYLMGTQAQQDVLDKGVSAPLPSSGITAEVLGALAPMAADRFQVVKYTGSDKVGVLDKSAQQSTTLEEARKRASNPFQAALPNTAKGGSGIPGMTSAVTNAAAIAGGVGWQSTLKNYKKNILGI